MVFRDLDKKSILENSARVLSTISVVGTDISFTEETNIAEWSYEDYRFVPENGFIGQFTERLLDGKLKELASDVNIENAEINLKIGIINGIDNKTTYYDYGNFLITKVGEKDTTGTTSFESADFVKKFNQVYVDTISYPCLSLELTNNVCEQVGVELAGNGKAYCIAIDDEGLEQGSYAFLVDNTYYNFNTTKNLNYHDTIMLIKIDNDVRIVQKTVDTITYNVERIDLSYTKTTYRNLLDVSKFVPGRLDNGVIGYTGDSSIDSYDAITGSITYTTTKNWRGIVSDFIPIDSSKTYVGQYKTGAKYNIDYYDKDKKWIQRAKAYNWVDGDISYCVPTIPSNTTYVVINAQASTTGTFSYSNMQFIESSTKQEFVPYESILGARGIVYNDFTNNDFSIENNQFDEGTLCRDVIKNIAKIGYTWARVGVDNKLYLDFTPKTSSDVDEYNKINTDQYYNEESQLEEYGPVNKVLLGLSNVEGENVYKEQTVDEVSIISINGNTQQDGEPSPTEPIPVKVVNAITIKDAVADEVLSMLEIDLKGNELCAGDSVTIVDGRCTLHKVMSKYTFTGDERITRNITYNNHYRYSIYSTPIDYKTLPTNETVPNIKCNRFVAISPNRSWGWAGLDSATGISMNLSGGPWFIRYEDASVDTIEKFATWLKANPVTAYYELQTPIDIDLGYVGNLRLFEGTNIITIISSDIDTTGTVVVTDIDKKSTKYSGTTISIPVKGYKTCQINLYDNPILYTQELRQIALNGCEKLFGLRYLPFTTKTIGHPWLEGDDYIQLDNLDGKTLYTYPFDRKLEYKGYIKSDIASTAKTDIEQKYEFESELLSRIVSAEIIVNKAEGVILANTKKMSQLEQGISNANININNLRDSINQTLTDYAKSEDVVQLRQAVETQQTETNLKIEIINEVLEGGISKVKTSKGYTFDDEGLKIADSESEITSKLDNKSFEVRDNTSGHTDTELLYAGIDSKTNESVVRSENLTVRKYCTIGTNSRFEDFEKNNKPGTGVFFIG